MSIGYDETSFGMNLKDVINEESRSMGHAFVLKMMLLGERLWEEEEPPTLEYKMSKNIENEQSNEKESISIKKKEKKKIFFTGFLIKSKNYYLISLPLNRSPTESNDKEDCWSIVKDFKQNEEKQKNLFTILNNLLGINFEKQPFIDFLPPNLTPFKEISYGKKIEKNLQIFLVDDKDGVLLDLQFVCSSFLQGKFIPLDLKNKPIISCFKWVDLETAQKLVYPSQKSLFK